jgi:hypothetical protein
VELLILNQYLKKFLKILFFLEKVQKVCLGRYFLVNLKRTQNNLKLQRKMNSSSSNSRRLERKKTKKKFLSDAAIYMSSSVEETNLITKRFGR